MVKTQAPYTISENRDFDVKLRDKNRCAIGVIYTRQDAELIHAVLNAHDGLVAACRETLGLIRTAQERLYSYLRPDTSDDPVECMNDLLEMFDGPEQREIEKKARAALAGVKGE